MESGKANKFQTALVRTMVDLRLEYEREVQANITGRDSTISELDEVSRLVSKLTLEDQTLIGRLVTYCFSLEEHIWPSLFEGNRVIEYKTELELWADTGSEKILINDHSDSLTGLAQEYSRRGEFGRTDDVS